MYHTHNIDTRRYQTIVCACVCITKLAATYLVYTLKIRVTKLEGGVWSTRPLEKVQTFIPRIPPFIIICNLHKSVDDHLAMLWISCSEESENAR